LKTHLFALTALFFLLTATSCQKKPTASFSTNKEVYSIGEKVLLSNASSDAYYYTWIVKGPEKEESRGSKEDHSFILTQYGSYDISLSVYSKNGKQVSRSSKTITVTAKEGNAIFYTTRSGTSYEIYQNGTYYGNFGGTFSGVPNCGATGAYTFTGDAGQYSFMMINYFTSATRTYSVNITAGACQPVLVNF
jgi:photosystem II stability/assembly factor-like uncharacterized protein